MVQLLVYQTKAGSYVLISSSACLTKLCHMCVCGIKELESGVIKDGVGP